MTRFIRLALITGLLLVLMCSSAYAIPDWSFTLVTSGLSAPSGSTLTWEYTISNPDWTNRLVMTGLSSGIFQNGVPDASVFDLPILAPQSTVSGNLFQFTWDATATQGSTNSGYFTLSAEWYDGGFNFLETAPERSAFYAASVDNGGAPVPEPSTLLLLGVGGGAVAMMRGKWRMLRKFRGQFK